MLIAVVVSIPLFMVWASIEPILLFLRQSPDVVPLAASYLMFISPVLVIASLGECITKWFTTQVGHFPYHGVCCMFLPTHTISGTCMEFLSYMIRLLGSH